MIYDYNTKNASFLKVHGELKRMGIINNAFMLELNNEKLVGINPFSPELSDELKIMIIAECIENFWYFAREVVCWRNEQFVSPTKLDRGNAAMYWNTLNGVSTWRSNIRQTCSDLSVNTILLWRLLSTQEVDTKYVSTSKAEANLKLEGSMDMIRLLPPALNPILKLNHDGCVGRHPSFISNHLNHSKTSSMPSPRSKSGADNLFRGQTSDIVFFHQAEHIPQLERMIISRAPVKSMGDKIRINIYNSTYGKDDYPTTIFAEKFIEGMIKWKDCFYDLNFRDFYTNIHTYGNGNIYIKHDYAELGYDEDWFDTMKKFLDHKNLNREVLLVRSTSAGNDKPKPKFINQHQHELAMMNTHIRFGAELEKEK